MGPFSIGDYSFISQFSRVPQIGVSKFYPRSRPLNKCTASYFHVQNKDYFICNVLKVHIRLTFDHKT